MKKVIQSTMMACLALICMCLASCNDEAIVDMSQSNEMGQPFRLTATQETPSRLALGQDGLSITWEPGDQLVLVKKDRSIVPIYMNAELDAPAASATFVSETGVPSGEYWVIYNYNDDLAYTHQTFSSIENINNNDKLVLWGELTIVEGASSAEISLQHLYAKVRVELQNVPSSNTWYKIGMYASKSGFPIFKQFIQTGMIDADYVYNNNSWEYTYKASRRKYHNIRLGGYYMETYPDELGESHSNKEEIEKNAALILPADVSDGTVYFYILDGNDCYEITKSNIKFEPGKSYKVVLDMSKATKTTLNGVNISLPGDSYSTTFYQLSSPSECRHAAYRARTYDSFILMNDIDFQNDNFLPLTARNLYGNDKVLKNISLEWDDEDYVGLIKYDFDDYEEGGNIDYNNSRLDPMNRGCRVTGLTLENVQVEGYNYVGALSATNIKADNCKIKGTSSVIGKGDYVGGFVGCNQFFINLLHGDLPSSISNSTIDACPIKGNNYVGGFVGKYTNYHENYHLYLDSSMRLLNSCSSAAIVEATGDYVGGIFGQIGDHTSVNFNSEDYVLSLYGCVNTGSVKGKDNVGGIGGAFSIYNTSFVKDKVIVMQSANEGNIEGANNVGGILGTNFASVNLCYSIGDFSATGNRLGGIVGSISGAASSNYITNCYSMANLSVGTGGYAGGLLGSNDGGVGVAQIENCYFAGTNSTNCGIIGYSGSYVNITNCLTTLSTEGDITPKQADWDINGDGYVDANDVFPIDVINTFTSVTSIRNNKSVINNDNAYSDEIWYNYNYDCVKFAAGLTGNVTAPGFGTEIIY